MVFATDPEDVVVLDEEVLRALFDLTPAEAKLTRLIGQGATLTEAGLRLNLRSETVRSRLKTIFEKTGAHRQAELVRLVIGATRI
jgi:DNA-binding CsgD family transcriptional regulator